jgi:glutathione S-transferase
MVSVMKLYSGPLSMFGAKVQIALAEKGITYDLELVAFDMLRLYEPKHPEVLRINPKGQVPVLIDRDLELFDSTQIFEYLDDLQPSPALWPREPALRARARLLEHKSDEVYFPHIIRLMGFQDRPNEPNAIAARDAAAVFYAEMERTLAGSDFLAGPITFADIAFYVAQFFGERMGAPLSKTLPGLIGWRTRMSSRPAVRAVMLPMVDFLAKNSRPVPTPLTTSLTTSLR